MCVYVCVCTLYCTYGGKASQSTSAQKAPNGAMRLMPNDGQTFNGKRSINVKNIIQKMVTVASFRFASRVNTNVKKVTTERK